MQGKNKCMQVPQPNAYWSKESLPTFITVFQNTATKPQYFPRDMQAANRMTKQFRIKATLSPALKTHNVIQVVITILSSGRDILDPMWPPVSAIGCTLKLSHTHTHTFFTQPHEKIGVFLQGKIIKWL